MLDLNLMYKVQQLQASLIPLSSSSVSFSNVITMMVFVYYKEQRSILHKKKPENNECEPYKFPCDRKTIMISQKLFAQVSDRLAASIKNYSKNVQNKSPSFSSVFNRDLQLAFENGIDKKILSDYKKSPKKRA